jgi:uncharacterized protein YkwD
MRRCFALLLALFMTACAAMQEGPPPLTRQQLEQVQTRLYAYIRDERSRMNGAAKPLALDPELAAAAQAHSDLMAQRRAFDSGGTEDNVAIQRLLANPKFRGYVGENSAMQYFTPEAGIDPDQVARGFADQWLKSAEHRNHIGFAAFDRTGIGITANDREIYAAQIFSTDLGLPEAP